MVAQHSGLHLYQLSDAYTLLSELASDPDTDPGTWDVALAGLKDEAEAKVANCGLLLQEWRADELAISTEIARLEARRLSLASAQDRLKSYLVANMASMELERVKTPLITVWLGKSTRVEADPAQLPACYLRATVAMSLDTLPESLRSLAKVEPDKAAIKAAIEDGDAVPGAALIETKHVRLR